MFRREVGTLKETGMHFQWIIENYPTVRNMTDVGSSIKSPIFYEKWYLELYPKGYDPISKNFLSIYVFNEQNISVTANVVISVMDKNNETIERCGFKNRVFEGKGSKGSNLGFLFAFQCDSDLLVNNTLILQCEIYTIDYNCSYELVKAKFDGTQVEDVYSRIKELSFFEVLLNNQEKCDVTFNIDGKQIGAHKIILMARSPVFKTLFTIDMIENYENIVEITDVKYEVFKELLRFLYSGKIVQMENHVKDLLIVANKYAVQGLKDICEKDLSENITINNVLEYLIFADTYDCLKLKVETVEFAVENIEGLANKPEFKTFGQTKTQLDLLHLIVQAVAETR